ncbi:hypothetical protein FGO68_gene4201 [Halteria grandinella]|uniref:Uncharacterized protein n=1 Tax=Halteria grandinella TaxID=5974 RepID=A0A8J8P8K4_HALGN|nr:hypothetical protein FGO68_gene4201 [Halteria grandinella]
MAFRYLDTSIPRSLSLEASKLVRLSSLQNQIAQQVARVSFFKKFKQALLKLLYLNNLTFREQIAKQSQSHQFSLCAYSVIFEALFRFLAFCGTLQSFKTKTMTVIHRQRAHIVL